MSNVEKVKHAFIGATTAKKYRTALRLAQRLRGRDQLVILDALFAAADRLKVARTTGEPLGMTQRFDGSVMVTWETITCRPDGSEGRTVTTAILQPAESGPGWKADQDVPEEVADAVTRAALEEQLRVSRPTKPAKRIYVR